MHVRADSLDEEIRGTVDAAMELANAVLDDLDERDRDNDRDRADADRVDPVAHHRRVLVDHDFVRAQAASEAEMQAFVDRFVPIARLLDSLPDADLVAAVERVNAALESCAIAPSLSAHDGFALHIHWTSPSTPFAHQVIVDLLMAVAQTLCDHGIDRFGRCGAGDCRRLFYDATKNRSRRFCSDQRCASRTHTAAHRARRASTA